jgi:hypothetical protein
MTEASLASQITALLQQWNAREAEMRNWMAGPVDGGANGDGRFPLTDASGRSYLAPSLLKLADLVEGPAGLSLQAQLLSEAARDAALTHRDGAAVHASTATTARTDAITAKNLAETYKNEVALLRQQTGQDRAAVQALIGGTNVQLDAQLTLVEAIADDMLIWRDNSAASASLAQYHADRAAAAATFDPDDFAFRVHGHTIGDVSGLADALSGRAPAVHGHAMGDVTGLIDALAGKQPSGSYAASVHAHGIGDVTGLQGALDGKALSVHGHAIDQVAGLQEALDGKQPSGSYLLTSGFTWDALPGKPTTFTPAAHSHAISDVTNLQTTLNGKAPAFLGQSSRSTSTTLDDTYNNYAMKLTGSTARTLTCGTPTAGMSAIISNRGSATWTVSVAGGVYKNGATTTVTSFTAPAGAHFTMVHEGSGVWTADGTGLA